MKHQNEEADFLLGQFENILDMVHCSKSNMFTNEQFFSSEIKEKNGNEPNIINKDSLGKKDEQTKANKDKLLSETVYVNEKYANTKLSIKGDSLSLPKHQVLQKHRAWEKAFRPLKIEEDDKHNEIIDVKKTVDFIAQTEIEQVIFKTRKRERYILNLLIDKDHSMEMFTELIEEFISSIEHYGVFLSVHYFYLDEGNIYRDKYLSTKVEKLYQFSQKNVLTLIISNCVSSAWKSNVMFKLIEDLSQHTFCSIVQMLPSHLWLLTALGQGTELTFKHVKEKMVLNSNLVSEDEFFFFKEEQKVLKVPVLAFEPNAFSVWASFASNDKRFKISGMAFDDMSKKEISLYEFTEQERLDGFLENSTDIAIHLASYMANLPVSFDIARMIQEEKFPTSNITHLSEVFLGGIIERIEVKSSVRYIFRKVARDYLKQFISANEAYALLENFVSQKLSSSLNLSAFFANEKGSQSLAIDEETLELMRLAIDIKKRMGGTDYDEAVVRENELNEIEEKRKIKVITPSTKRYQMGSKENDDEKPIHEVIINYDFEISPTQVTVREFKVFVEETNYVTEAEKGDGAYVYDGKEWNKKKDVSWKNPYFEQTDENPVVCVSWNDTQAYIIWLNEKTNEVYRLPTEAEWEFSCRAGSTEKWHFGDKEEELEKYAWYDKNSFDLGKEHACFGTNPVGKKLPNQWGLYDMHGNVWEWCQDDFENNYNNTPKDGSEHIRKKTEYKSIRGASWIRNVSDTHLANRDGYSPSHRVNSIGFRLLRILL